MIGEPTVSIRLDGNGRAYRPGERFGGEYVFHELPACQLRALEVSVLWFTEGKGDEDLGVHRFWRFDPERGARSTPGSRRGSKPSCPRVRFRTTARS